MPIFRVGAIVVVSALVSLACGQVSQVSKSDGEAGQPKHGGIVNLEVSSDPFDWDTSYVGKGVPNDRFIGLSYDSLLGYKTGSGVGYHERALIPKLAERWEVSPDAKTYTFHLRKGVKFANLPPVNGRELTAADVKWSYEYSSRTGEFKEKNLPKGFYEYLFDGMARVETPDPYTVVIRFNEPSIPFLYYSAADHNVIMPKEIYEADGHLKDRMVGSGPFQLDRAASQTGTRWVWQKNQNYWEAGKPYLDTLRWLVIPDSSTSMAAFKSRQLDMIVELPPSTADEVKKNNPDAVAHEMLGVFGDFWLRVADPPLSDVRVRRAIALSVDRDEFMRVFQGGRGAWQMPHILTDYFTQEEIKKLQPYNPSEAKQLLTEAGHPNGLDLELTYPGSSNQYSITHNELLQAQLKKSGINLVLKSIDQQAYTTNRKKGEFTVNLLTGSDAKWDVDTTLFKFHANSASNYAGTKDAKLTQLIDAQRGEVDEVKRSELIRQAGRIIAEQAYGIVMYTPVKYGFWHPHVKNYSPNRNLYSPPLRETWLNE